MIHTPITPDLPIAEAGRRMMADELSTIQAFWPELRLSAEVTAVHETRKAIRRTFTLVKLFAPYFAPGRLEQHRDGLRRIMRRLAPCRDAAVFRLKLATYNETAGQPLTGLSLYWDERQAKVDGALGAYLGRKQAVRIMDRFAHLATTEGSGLPPGKTRAAPVLVRHALPGMVLARVGAVRAWGEILPAATPRQFHQLRIQFKELRYTLSFFEDILSAEAGEILELSRGMQEHLGNLNDASVAVDLLDNMKHGGEEAVIYRRYQAGELARLTEAFQPLYAEFDRPEVRRTLAIALSTL